MRIFTCTPVDFGPGDEGFFARDSGLLCRGLQTLGFESCSIMPGQKHQLDKKDLLRATSAELESADWWRSLQLDGVVLYAWGRPKFRKVAAAIRRAGVFLILNQDSAGLVSPLGGFREWLRAQWIYGGRGCDVLAVLGGIRMILRGLTIGLGITDPLRAQHLKQGDVIACVSPVAATRYRRLCRLYGGEALANRVRVLPHAVEQRFVFSDGKTKRRQVVCVGRWEAGDEVQKRAGVLMQTLQCLLAKDDEVVVVVVGRHSNALECWHTSLIQAHHDRVRLAGNMERDELAALMEESQVFYSPSAFESFGIAAAEALCCGCTVVANRAITMPSFEWFVSENSGRLTPCGNPEGHARAIEAELQAWGDGERDAAEISRVWSGRLHADEVARQVVTMVIEAL